MTTKNSNKTATNYICEKCNFITSKKSNYNAHILTAKHKRTTTGLQKEAIALSCECGKIYSCRQNLFRHKLKCDKKSIFQQKNSHEENELVIDSDIDNVGMMLELIKQNHDFKDLLIEQQKENQELQKKLINAVSEGKTIHNTTNNNQKFNLNFFLNTTCKDAMNMSEFIENIQIDFKDIENIGKIGYVEGMTNMILSRIKDLDITKRPLHCTDLKRETMYIKDNDQWEKDTPENSKLHDMISIVAKQNYTTLPLWKENHPECFDGDHPQYSFCLDMMRNILGDVGNEQIKLDNKVIKNLSRHILIDKK